jgi:hypothetical protein
MSRCDDEDDNAPASAELLAHSVAEAVEFLVSFANAPATRITRGPEGEGGAIFILRNQEDVAKFTKLYYETFDAREETVDVIACNVPPDLESN